MWCGPTMYSGIIDLANDNNDFLHRLLFLRVASSVAAPSITPCSSGENLCKFFNNKSLSAALIISTHSTLLIACNLSRPSFTALSNSDCSFNSFRSFLIVAALRAQQLFIAGTPVHFVMSGVRFNLCGFTLRWFSVLINQVLMST